MPAPARPTKAPTAGRKMTRPVADVGPANPSAKAKRTAARKAVQPPAPPLLTSLKYSPGYAPELLALAVVSRLGEQVRAQLAWLRETYPTATADGLARLGVRRYVREARRRGAVAGLAGSLAVLAEPTSLTWTQAKLVLHIATAYGQDPTDPFRGRIPWRVQPSPGRIRGGSANPERDVPEPQQQPASVAEPAADRRTIQAQCDIPATAFPRGVR